MSDEYDFDKAESNRFKERLDKFGPNLEPPQEWHDEEIDEDLQD